MIETFSSRCRSLLSQRLAPAELAWALSLGAVIGISPLLWGTGVVCAALAARLRLNQAAIQIANVAMWPVQLILFVPWLQLGRRVCAVFPPFSGETAAAVAGPLGLIMSYAEANLQGLLAWLMISPLAVALLFILLHPSCRRLLPGRMT